MKQNDIFRLALQAGFKEGDLSLFPSLLTKFADLVAAEVGIAQYQRGYAEGQSVERAVCAKELRRLHAENEDYGATIDHLARENAEQIGEIERLRAMLAAAPQPKLYPLPDDLYGGSKDWRAGSYAERVEWLHLMYEGAKEEIERLGQTQGEQAQPKSDPLSDEQILKLGWAVTPYANQMEMLSIARAIERAHGIKGEA